MAHGDRGPTWRLFRLAPRLSPEQARGQTVDKRTDIWAFGCVLYEMHTGRAAFARDTIRLRANPSARPRQCRSGLGTNGLRSGLRRAPSCERLDILEKAVRSHGSHRRSQRKRFCAGVQDVEAEPPSVALRKSRFCRPIALAVYDPPGRHPNWNDHQETRSSTSFVQGQDNRNGFHGRNRDV